MKINDLVKFNNGYGTIVSIKEGIASVEYLNYSTKEVVVNSYPLDELVKIGNDMPRRKNIINIYV